MPDIRCVRPAPQAPASLRLNCEGDRLCARSRVRDLGGCRTLTVRDTRDLESVTSESVHSRFSLEDR